jgi:hypothetical protein
MNYNYQFVPISTCISAPHILCNSYCMVLHIINRYLQVVGGPEDKLVYCLPNFSH